MMAICYVCNSKSKFFTRNLNEIKSKHSATPIVEFVRRFVKDYETQRNVANEFNCICNICLSKIYAYDWTCMKAKEQETELRCMLLKTESLWDGNQFDSEGLAYEQIDTVNENGVIDLIDDGDDDDDKKVDDKINIKTEVKPANIEIDRKNEGAASLDVKPISESTSQPTEASKIIPPPPKKGKPIIVRVVKRVPFLKTKPDAPPSKQTPAILSGEGSSKPVRQVPIVGTKSSTKKTVAKKSTSSGGIPICKYCDGRFPNDKILQVSFMLH